MKKICIFTGYVIPHLGGVERYTDKISEVLAKNGNEVTIVTSNENNYPDYEEREYYKVYRLPILNLFKNRYPLLNYNEKFRITLEQLRKQNFDMYICQTRFHLTSLIGLNLAKRNKKVPIIIEHGSSHFTVNNKILDFFGSIYEHCLTYYVKTYNPRFYGVSERCNQWLKHFSIKADGILYNSISEEAYDTFKDTQYIKNKKKNKIYIAYIGRVMKEKGIELLLDAFKDLNIVYQNIELYIAGDGPNLDEYKIKYSQQNIHFEGKIPYEDVMKLCNSIDIFVYPSMYPEGLPTSILEAGLMKTAVIATDRGGTTEVINNSKYGLIMEENINSLKENLKYLLDNPNEIQKLKNNLHKRIINNFTWSITAEKLMKEAKKGKKN